MRKTKSAASSSVMGNQEPTVRIAPNYDKSDGFRAAKLLKVGGLTLDPWQMDVLDDWMSFSPSGKWSCSTCGGSVPRQNGKTLLLQGRATCGMLMYREEVIYTAHLQKTATETFEEMREFFEGPKIIKYVKDIKTALGREQIILNNGGKIKFLARTRNGGRGQHGDLLIIDEAQEIDENAQASFLPAISASLNPQTIYVGTPPDPTAPGIVFRGIRDKALEGKTSRTAWFEYSVDEIGNVSERERWAACNPALGRRILLSTIESECEQMDADTFARERLGWWSPVITQEVEKAIDPAVWAACASMNPKPEGKTAYAVKFASDDSEAVLCGAIIPPEGPARITLINRKPAGYGTKWLADWLIPRYNSASCVVIDGRNGVDVLVDRISDTWKYKGSIIKASANDMIAAVSVLMDALTEKTVTWYAPQTDMNESALSSIKRTIGKGWGFGGDDSTPIETAALALWGAKTCKRDPSRKMRIG